MVSGSKLGPSVCSVVNSTSVVLSFDILRHYSLSVSFYIAPSLVVPFSVPNKFLNRTVNPESSSLACWFGFEARVSDYTNSCQFWFDPCKSVTSLLWQAFWYCHQRQKFVNRLCVNFHKIEWFKKFLRPAWNSRWRGIVDISGALISQLLKARYVINTYEILGCDPFHDEILCYMEPNSMFQRYFLKFSILSIRVLVVSGYKIRGF